MPRNSGSEQLAADCLLARHLLSVYGEETMGELAAFFEGCVDKLPPHALERAQERIRETGQKNEESEQPHE